EDLDGAGTHVPANGYGGVGGRGGADPVGPRGPDRFRYGTEDPRAPDTGNRARHEPPPERHTAPGTVDPYRRRARRVPGPGTDGAVLGEGRRAGRAERVVQGRVGPGLSGWRGGPDHDDGVVARLVQGGAEHVSGFVDRVHVHETVVPV